MKLQKEMNRDLEKKRERNEFNGRRGEIGSLNTKKERDRPGRRPDDGCATHGGGGGEWRLSRVTLELGARRDAMTYRPRSPRALTSRSRSESDWEHVNSTPAITRPRPDRAAPIGQPLTSPSSRLVAPARPAWSRTSDAGAGRLAFPELVPTWESFIAPRDARPLRTAEIWSLHFCQRGLGARYVLFFLFFLLFGRCVPIVFFSFLLVHLCAVPVCVNMDTNQVPLSPPASPQLKHVSDSELNIPPQHCPPLPAKLKRLPRSLLQDIFIIYC